MTDVFLKLVNMSISASWLVLAVLLLRGLFRNAPKWLSPLLWGIVGLRLLQPFSIESALSLIPSTQTINTSVFHSRPYIHSGISAIDQPANEYLGTHYFEGVTVPANNTANIATILTCIWLIGAVALLLYGLFSYLRIRRQVQTAVRLRENIFQSEQVVSPFVLGFFCPRIYLPFTITSQDMAHIIAHEQAHIKRRDHWWKPLGFLLLAIYWFNPVMWLAYSMLCRDIELACDEKVIRSLSPEARADYSQALLQCSLPRRSIAACPLAFGETGVKERIKSVLHYKKPAFWVIALAVIAGAVLVVCFLTDPNAPSTPHAWTSSVKFEDVTLCTVTRQDRTYTLWDAHYEPFLEDTISRHQLEQLIEILNQLPEDSFSQGHNTYERSVMLRCGDKEYWLQYGNGITGIAFDPETAAQYPTQNGTWQIQDEALSGFMWALGALQSSVEDTPTVIVPSMFYSTIVGYRSDLNRDGIAERMEITTYPGQRQVLQIYNEKDIIWTEEATFAHHGWNSLFLCKVDGKDCLLRYQPAMFQGICNYSYQLFHLQGGKETLLDAGQVSFDINFGSSTHKGFDPAAIGKLLDTVNSYLANGMVLMNTDENLQNTFAEHGAPQDTIWFLDSREGFVRDASKSLTENLQTFQQYCLQTVP